MTLLGRTADLDDLRAIMADGTVCLVGAPGIGKTALARALGPDVVVDLEGLQSPEDVQTALATGLQCSSRQPLAIRRALAACRMVVFDAVGPVDISPWLGHCPVIITRRDVGGSTGSVFHVGPLSREAGAALIRARLRDARRAATLGEPALLSLAEALDGVPLALELAASALRLHAPEVVASVGLRAIAGSEPLTAGIETMLRQLPGTAREALRAAVFVGPGFDAPLLSTVLGRSADADLLALLDQSLVHPEATTPPTFRVLRPIRDAIEHSEVSEEVFRERLAAQLSHFEAVAEALSDGGSAAPALAARPLLVRLVASPRDEVRLRAALALAAIERRLGPVTDTLARDAAMPDAGPEPLRAKWSMAAAVAACHAFQPDRAEGLLARGAIHVPAELAPDWLETRAQVAALAGRTEEALALCEEAIARDRQGWRYFRKGGVHYQRGEVDQAADCFARAREGTRGFRFAQASYAYCIALHDTGAAPHDVLAEVSRAERAVNLEAFPWLQARLAMVRGILHFDLGDLVAASERIAWAQEAFLGLGEADEALNAWMVSQWVALVEGAPIVEQPPLAGGRLGRAEALQAVARALDGDWERAGALALVAERAARELAWPDADELCAYLAVALAPGLPALSESLCRGSWADRARAAIAGTLEVSDRNEDRILRAIAARRGGLVRVQRDGAAFVDASGARVDLARRRVLRRVLEVLATTEQPLTVAAICEAVWPGEALVGDSGTRRVHVAISSLRGLGLRDAIVTHDGGGPTSWSLACPVVDLL